MCLLYVTHNVATSLVCVSLTIIFCADTVEAEEVDMMEAEVEDMKVVEVEAADMVTLVTVVATAMTEEVVEDPAALCPQNPPSQHMLGT